MIVKYTVSCNNFIFSPFQLLVTEMAADKEYCVLWFKNSRGESVASIVTPVLKGARGSALPMMVQRDKKNFSNKDPVSSQNTFEKPLIGDDALAGAEFLFIPERNRGDSDEKAVNSVAGLAAEDATENPTAPTKPSPKARQNRNSTRSKEAQNPKNQKNTRFRSRSARPPKEVPNPEIPKSTRSRSRSARPKGLSDQNINPRQIPSTDNGKRKRYVQCVVCRTGFDHEVKLSGHMNTVHSKVLVEKPFECQVPGCDYR